MPETLQQKTLVEAQTLKTFAGQLSDLAQQLTDFKRRSDKYNYIAIWSAQPTAPWNADGSQGTTDSQPVITNPIIGLNMCANDLISMQYAVNQLLQFLNGTQEALPQTQVNQYERIDSLLDT